jgi:SAM-dependent methyltransferase
MLMPWLSALEERHLADLTFSEVARALRALSSTYVERRERLARKTAFDSAGKRAAYALYYSPLHFLTVEHIVQRLELDARPLRRILDLGCGAGAAGAAWASRLVPPASVTGVDAHPWALAESAFTYRAFGLQADTKRGDVSRTPLGRTDAIIAGWLLNELDHDKRVTVQSQLLQAAAAGASILIVEPIATRVAPWWKDWVQTFQAVGAEAAEWRFPVDLPPLVRQLDKAAGLRHDELTARSLCLVKSGHPRSRDSSHVRH